MITDLNQLKCLSLIHSFGYNWVRLLAVTQPDVSAGHTKIQHATPRERPGHCARPGTAARRAGAGWSRQERIVQSKHFVTTDARDIGRCSLRMKDLETQTRRRARRCTTQTNGHLKRGVLNGTYPPPTSLKTNPRNRSEPAARGSLVPGHGTGYSYSTPSKRRALISTQRRQRRLRRMPLRPRAQHRRPGLARSIVTNIVPAGPRGGDAVSPPNRPRHTGYSFARTRGREASRRQR